MKFITIKTKFGYDITINIDSIVTFHDSDEMTKIRLVNGEIIEASGFISGLIRKHLSKLGYDNARIGE